MLQYYVLDYEVTIFEYLQHKKMTIVQGYRDRK